MNEYYAIITQNGYSLEASEVNLPHQFSENIPIKIIKDDQIFNGYQLLPFFVHSNYQYIDVVNANEGFPIEYDEETQIGILPYSAFKKRGYLFVSVAMKETSGNKIFYTGTVMFTVNESINGTETVSAESVWIDAITQFVDNYMDSKYKPQYDEITKNLNDLVENAKNQQLELSNTLETTQNLQQDVQDLINQTSETIDQYREEIDKLIERADESLLEPITTEELDALESSK